MKQHTATRHAVDKKRLRLRVRPTDRDYDLVIDEDADVREVGVGPVTVCFRRVVPGWEPLLAALRAVPFRRGNARSDGMKNMDTRTVGFLPRLAVRRDFCCTSSVAQESPAAHAAIVEAWAQRAAGLYRECSPEQYAKHERAVEGVLPEWRLPGTPFTSGICNHDNPLAYHTDTGNFRGVWSCMFALTSGCDGGLLVLPEYRLAFRFGECSFITFDGQVLLHGVTPLVKRSALAYRYSVVYYSLAGMRFCLTPEEELARIRKLKTEREYARLDPAKAKARIDRFK